MLAIRRRAQGTSVDELLTSMCELHRNYPLGLFLWRFLTESKISEDCEERHGLVLFGNVLFTSYQS